jgi:hypothetical protein
VVTLEEEIIVIDVGRARAARHGKTSLANCYLGDTTCTLTGGGTLPPT